MCVSKLDKNQSAKTGGRSAVANKGMGGVNDFILVKANPNVYGLSLIFTANVKESAISNHIPLMFGQIVI